MNITTEDLLLLSPVSRAVYIKDHPELR